MMLSCGSCFIGDVGASFLKDLAVLCWCFIKTRNAVWIVKKTSVNVLAYMEWSTFADILGDKLHHLLILLEEKMFHCCEFKLHSCLWLSCSGLKKKVFSLILLFHLFVCVLGCEDPRNQQWNIWALGTVWSGDGQDNSWMQGTVLLLGTDAGGVIFTLITALCVDMKQDSGMYHSFSMTV